MPPTIYGIIAASGYYTVIFVASLRPWPINPYPLRFYGIIYLEISRPKSLYMIAIEKTEAQ